MAYISDFNNNEEYGASDINAIRQSIATAGVVQETATSMKVTAIGGGKVRILEGQAIFASGARIAIDNEGHELTVIGTGKNYVYVKREQNSSEPYITTTAPTGDYVLLAEVTGQTVTDKRQYSAFKVTRGLGNGYFVKKNEDSIKFTVPTYTAWQKYTTIETDSAEYIFAYLKADNSGCFFDFGNDTLQGFYKDGNNSSLSSGAIQNGYVYRYSVSGTGNTYLRLSYVGTSVEFWAKNDHGSSQTSVSVDLYLM